MAAATAPALHHGHAPPPRSTPPATSPPHGTKRPADGALDGEQRLSKRFDLLNLDTTKGARLHVPSTPPRPRRAPPPASPDAMHVEDTPHRVYIHDLAAELSDADLDAEPPLFLPDIERHLSRIPRHLLRSPPPAATAHNQVVLYNVPASLTVPEERDSVRKAIVEARQRIREKQGLDTVLAAKPADDADAMDLD